MHSARMGPAKVVLVLFCGFFLHASLIHVHSLHSRSRLHHRVTISISHADSHLPQRVPGERGSCRIRQLNMSVIGGGDAIGDVRKADVTSRIVNFMKWMSGTISFPSLHLPQILAIMTFFTLHFHYLSRNELPFPSWLVPGRSLYVPLDALVGGLSFAITAFCLALSNKGLQSPMRVILKNPLPWRRPRQHPLRTFFVVLSIVFAFYFASAISKYLPLSLDILANFLPLTVAVQQSLQLFLGHFFWVLPSCVLLLSVKRFYGFDNLDCMEQSRKV